MRRCRRRAYTTALTFGGGNALIVEAEKIANRLVVPLLPSEDGGKSYARWDALILRRDEYARCSAPQRFLGLILGHGCLL